MTSKIVVALINYPGDIVQSKSRPVKTSHRAEPSLPSTMATCPRHCPIVVHNRDRQTECTVRASCAFKTAELCKHHYIVSAFFHQRYDQKARATSNEIEV